METVLVWLIVSAAALWSARRLFSRRGSRRGKPVDSCSGNCSSCAFAAGSSGCASAVERDDGGAHRLTVIGALALAAALPGEARAADTVETWDPGAADVELYLGLDGLGSRRADRAVGGEVVIGYGVAERVSAYLATTLQANGFLADGHPEVGLGVFGTPVDLDRFDLDLMLELGAAGEGLSLLEFAPGVEANLDLDSPVGPWGVYLRAAAPVGGEEHVHPDGSTTYRTGHRFDFNPGIYWAPREGHQLLAEVAVARVPGAGDAPDAWENGGASLGYNVALSPTLELITQASAAPADRNGWVAGFMVGFIATLPSAPH